MSNLDKIKEYYVNNSPFAQLLGIEVVDLKQGYAKTKMELTNNHNNSIGITHGGAIFTLVDVTFGVAAISHGFAAVTTNASISYINPGIDGPLTAEAVELSSSKKLCMYEVKVTNSKGILIASAQGTMYKKKDPYPPVK